MAAEQRRQLMLEAAGLDRAVHPAFLGRAALPPPAARARIGTRPQRARARCASDRLETLVVERVVRNLVGADVVPDLFFGPVGHRRELYDSAVVVIDFDLADIGARRP